MQNINFDVAHLLAGSILVLSFVLLYQDRITAVLNVFALQAIALYWYVVAAVGVFVVATQVSAS